MQASTQAIPHPHLEDAHHEETGFWSKYIFSTDHKVIGIQYGFTALCFLFFGFCLMLMMRWQIAHPGVPVPLVGPLARERRWATWPPKGIMSDDLYNSFGAMHGTIMVFLAIVPLAFAALSAITWCRCRSARRIWLFRASTWPVTRFYVLGGVIMFVSFFIPGGAAQAGWTSYSPLATVDPDQRPNLLADRHGAADYFFTAGRGQFHCDHHSVARTGDDLDAVAVLLFGRSL